MRRLRDDPGGHGGLHPRLEPGCRRSGETTTLCPGPGSVKRRGIRLMSIAGPRLPQRRLRPASVLTAGSRTGTCENAPNVAAPLWTLRQLRAARIFAVLKVELIPRLQ